MLVRRSSVDLVYGYIYECEQFYKKKKGNDLFDISCFVVFYMFMKACRASFPPVSVP